MNGCFLAAGLFAGMTTFVHCWFGGREIAAPLLASRDMHSVARYTNYYAWHLVTIMLVAMAGAFLYAAFVPGGVELAALGTLIAGTGAIWSMGLIVWKHQRFADMPQWALCLSIAVAGAAGFFI